MQMSFTIHSQTSLGTVKLNISNLARSITFYEKIIGLKVLSQTEHTAKMTVDGTTVLLELVQVDDPYTGTKRGHTGLYHFAILLPNRKELSKILRHLIANQIAIGQADHLVSEALYLSDPDQNGIEIYRDRPRSEWEYSENGMVKMASDPIDWESLLAESEDEPFLGLSEQSIIGHIHLHVSSLEKAKDYYVDVLGFTLESDWSMNGALFVGAGGYHHHIGLNIWNGRGGSPLPSNATGIHYFTICISSAEQLEQIAGRIEEAEYLVERVVHSLYTVDPFGISIQFKLTNELE